MPSFQAPNLCSGNTPVGQVEIAADFFSFQTAGRKEAGQTNADQPGHVMAVLQ